MFTVLPLPIVQRWARSNLTREQLKVAIKEARELENYPGNTAIRISPCGEGLEFRFRNPFLGQQGWLRAIFWVNEKSKRIYIVDLFWKKTNQISKADLARSDVRIARLKHFLSEGGDPWKD